MNKAANQEHTALAENYDQFAQLFLAREDGIRLVSQLNQLMKAVQRHRGISMGLLAGNNGFQGEFAELQRQIERRLATLDAFARSHQLLSSRDKESVSFAWATIRSNWENDALIDNFELHSHFIEQLLIMIAGLAKKLEVPLMVPLAQSASSGVFNVAFSQERMLQQIEILNFVGKALPEVIEHVARIRGTAVYSAAVASLQGLSERKLRFWMEILRSSSSALRHQAESLDRNLSGAINFFDLVKSNELHLLQFLNTVESAVFLGKGGREEAHQLFNMATDIIEVYWRMVAEGLDVVRAWHLQDMEAWMHL